MTEAGVFRLGGAGLPAFLGGFALIAIYAGLMAWVRSDSTGSSPEALLLGAQLHDFAVDRRPARHWLWQCC